MDNNTNMNSQQPNAATPADNGGQGGRLFTQEEVNRIVSERLTREREKLPQQPQEDKREKALAEREKAVAARESRYKCEDHLKEIGVGEKYRADLLSALNTDDFDTFKAAMGKLEKYFVPIERGAPPPANPPAFYRESSDEQIKAAFAPGAAAPRPKIRL